jgi:stalled ribosome rescue protein Dom34
LKKFYLAVFNAIKLHFDLSVIKVVLIASPGFLKDDFLKWMFAEAVKNGEKVITDNKAKFVACQSSSGFKSVGTSVAVGTRASTSDCTRLLISVPLSRAPSSISSFLSGTL